MVVFDDPNKDLHWLEEELMEETEPEEIPSGRRRFSGSPTTAQRQAVYVEKKKENRGLKFLALTEFLAILGLIWWWIKWLY